LIETALRLRALALFVFSLYGDEQLKADLRVALEAGRELFLGFEGGFVGQPVLRV
jgi:hypothetical protein